MGLTKLTQGILEEIPFLRREDDVTVLCTLDRKSVKVTNGRRSILQHMQCKAHQSAGAQKAHIQPTVSAALTKTRDTQIGIKNALALHIIPIVMEGQSFRPSDPFSGTRRMYSRMFPDSVYANIRCGRTKVSF